MKYHQIADDSVKKAGGYFKYEQFKRGSIIYLQDTNPTHFYGIISGSVKIYKATKVKKLSVKKKTIKASASTTVLNEVKVNGSYYQRLTKIDIPEYEYETVNEEFGTKTKGMCFGYDGLINKAPRTSSVYAEEDTEMFTLDSTSFDLSFNVIYHRLYL